MKNKKRSIIDLRKQLQDKGNGRFYSDWTEIIPRFFSIYFTKFFIKIGVSANQITALSIIIGVSAAVFLALGRPIFIAIGSLLYFVVPVLDCSDGEISRFRKTGSATGEYFDRMAGAIIDPLILFAAGLCVYRYTQNQFDIIVCFIAGLSLVLIRLAIAHIYAVALSLFENKSKETHLNAKFEEEKKINFRFESIIAEPQISKTSSIISFLSDLFIKKTWGIIFWVWFAGLISFLSLIIPIQPYISEILRPLIWIYGLIIPIAVLYVIYRAMKNKIPDKLIEELKLI